MDKPCLILDDTREIDFISNPLDEEGWYYFVGRGGVTKIVAYGEPGQGAHVPFFAVYQGDEIVARVSAAHARISYKRGPEPVSHD